MKTTPEQEQMLLDSIQVLKAPDEIAMARAVCEDLATLRGLEGPRTESTWLCHSCGAKHIMIHPGTLCSNCGEGQKVTGLEGHGGTDHE